MATDRPRYTVSVDNELFQQIEDFRFEHRFQTRSEATVELIRLGLEALKKEQAAQKQEEALRRDPPALPRRSSGSRIQHARPPKKCLFAV